MMIISLLRPAMFAGSGKPNAMKAGQNAASVLKIKCHATIRTWLPQSNGDTRFDRVIDPF